MAGYSRRQVLGGLVAAGVASNAVSLACAPVRQPWVPAPLPAGPFLAGVASGDPLPARVTLWTRIVPPPGGAPVDLTWQVAADEAFTDLAASGSATATEDSDFAVTVGVNGLDPNRVWFYRFGVDGTWSPTGRTRTAPAPGSSPDRLRLAFLSCQMFSEGYFTAYRHVLDDDVDLVLHLGDYIYEYGTDNPEYGLNRFRTDPVDQPQTLEEFRSKYRLYRTDPDLRAAHQQLPFVAIWDDHEVYDDYDRDVDPSRRDAAYRAWFDHMPHLPHPEEPTRLYRSLRWGDLAELFLIDMAQYREREVPAPFVSLLPDGRMAHQESRTLVGDAQREWLKSSVAESDATWRVLGNPQMLQPLRIVDLDEPWIRELVPDLPTNAGVYLNGTQWDGYQAERREILGHWVDRGVVDNIVLTGDIHSWWVGGVPLDMDDPGSPVVAAEFVGGSVTSPSFDYYTTTRIPLLNDAVRRIAGSFEFANLFDHGYGICEITSDAVSVDFRRVDILDPAAGVETFARFRVDRGSPTIHRVG